jgi:hypothetical protein
LRTTSVRALAASLALAAGLATASTAAAITVKDIRITDSPSQIQFRATLVSPPSARTCTALVEAGLYRRDPNTGSGVRLFKKIGNTRINVCQTGRRGFTQGTLNGRFPMFNIRSDVYALCLRAKQTLRNGRTSAHTECKAFTHNG